MLISPDYLALQQQLHRQGRYGVSSGKWADVVRELAAREDCADILDYGCGQGQLQAALGEVVREYDPAIAGKDADPAPADLVVCTDVLEHIEPEHLDEVLLHLRAKTMKRLFFAIALRPAGKTLADGRNAHLIVETAAWWLDRLAPYFRVLEHAAREGYELSGIAQPVAIVGEIKAVGVMKDERNAHTRVNVLKTAKRIPDEPLPAHAGVALIACYGPSLRQTWETLPVQRKKLRATLVSVSGAYDFLRKHHVTPDIHVECDPRAHKLKMMRKRSCKTKYVMASCALCGGSTASNRHCSVILSSSAISSAVNVAAAALTLASTCSGLVAPAMTLATCGRAAIQAIARSRMVRPRWCANAVSASSLRQFVSVRKWPI
jgi:hypothetical protein